MRMRVPNWTGRPTPQRSPAPAHFASGTLSTHYGDTDFARSLADVAARLPVGDAGQSASHRKQIAILITGGVNDVGTAFDACFTSLEPWPCVVSFPDGNIHGKDTFPLDPASCDALKARGVAIGVLDTPCLPVANDDGHQRLVEGNAPQSAVRARLTACASRPGLFDEATDLAGLTAGLASLFAEAARTSTTRLTN
jgi:hypothetical protein